MHRDLRCNRQTTSGQRKYDYIFPKCVAGKFGGEKSSRLGQMEGGS